MILTMLVNRTQAYGHVTKLPRASDSFSRLHAGIGTGSEKSSNPFTIVSMATLMWPLVTGIECTVWPSLVGCATPYATSVKSPSVAKPN